MLSNSTFKTWNNLIGDYSKRFSFQIMYRIPKLWKDTLPTTSENISNLIIEDYQLIKKIFIFLNKLNIR